MAEHTPGPWDVVKNEFTRLVFVGSGDSHYGRYPIFTDGISSDEANARQWADAHLIAAAPELLEAVLAYREAVHAGIDADPELWQRAELLADYALARVTGRNRGICQW